MNGHGHEVELILGLVLLVAGVVWVANRLRVPYPVLLVVVGLALSFVPGLPRAELKPEHVFVLFLPPILFHAALLTSWRDFRANLRPIGTLAVGLVLATTALVAAVAHWLIPGMGWGPAFVLGAIVSPPDAVAATAVMHRLRVPRRIVTILEGESLVNDATALVAYRFAVAATVAVAGGFSLAAASGRFVVLGAGGVVVGYVAGMLVGWLRPRMRDSGVEQLLILMTPYVAYLSAEWAGVSGVLAVVTCGIYIARRVANTTSARVRLQAYATWETVIFVLNGLVFILIGLQLTDVRARLSDASSLGRLVWYGVAISLVAIVVRMVYVFIATALSARVPKRFRLPDPPPPPSQVFMVAWTAMRGVVSLAAALALPETLADRVTPFPHRDLILFITFGVILVTLVVQGFSLPLLIRWLKLDTFHDEHADEEYTARYLTALAAIERLDALVGPDGGNGAGAGTSGSAAAVQRLRATYDERLAYFSRLINPPEPGAATDLTALPPRDTSDAVLRETLAAERRMLFQLRDNGVIGDDVLRRVEQELDLEESKLGG